MVFSYTNGSGLITIQLDPNEKEVIDWALANFGPNTVKDWFDGLIKARTAQMNDSLKEELYSNYKNANPNDKANIASTLKLRGKP